MTGYEKYFFGVRQLPEDGAVDFSSLANIGQIQGSIFGLNFAQIWMVTNLVGVIGITYNFLICVLGLSKSLHCIPQVQIGPIGIQMRQVASLPKTRRPAPSKKTARSPPENPVSSTGFPLLIVIMLQPIIMHKRVYYGCNRGFRHRNQ